MLSYLLLFYLLFSSRNNPRIITALWLPLYSFIILLIARIYRNIMVHLLNLILLIMLFFIVQHTSTWIILLLLLSKILIGVWLQLALMILHCLLIYSLIICIQYSRSVKMLHIITIVKTCSCVMKSLRILL